MKQGVLVFAHNNDETDYMGMAAYTAARVNQFLDLPVTVVTDSVTVAQHNQHTLGVFDKVIQVQPDRANRRRDTVWINRGRCRAYEHSPYDETLLLDADYMINSQQLLRLFEMPSDIMAHNRTRFFCEDIQQERLNKHTAPIHWATVVRFRRSSRAQQLFSMMRMIEDNYEHYANIYGFQPYMFRNDYAFTIALRTVNAHLSPAADQIPWSLCHVGKRVTAHRESDTGYVLMFPEQGRGQTRQRYITVRDCDFHMLGKRNFCELAGVSV